MGLSVTHCIFLEAINIGEAGDTKAPKANLDGTLGQTNLGEAEGRSGVTNLGPRLLDQSQVYVLDLTSLGNLRTGAIK